MQTIKGWAVIDKGQLVTYKNDEYAPTPCQPFLVFRYKWEAWDAAFADEAVYRVEIRIKEKAKLLKGDA